MIRKLGSPYSNDPYDRPNNNFQDVQVAIEDRSDYDLDSQIRISSLRFSRRKFVFALTAFLVGGVLILMESPFKHEFLAPGPLSSSHAQILAGKGADRCAACHDSGDKSFSQWAISAFSKGNNAASCQSELCMKCHESSLNKEFASFPHNVDPSQLKMVTRKIQFVSAGNLVKPPVDHEGKIECGACHREHHGDVDLKNLTDHQCQTCHAQKFHRFETNHPEFASWPQKRRQRIAFDHVSHFYKHFPGKVTEFDCKACHVDDQFQSVKLLNSYANTCAKCHDKDIQGSSEEGLHLVRLPMLDLDAIQDQALSIGDWPESATGDFDGRISGLMRMLLFKDRYARSILEARGEDFEFGDFDPDLESDVKDAVTLAWSIKNLLYDLAMGGESELRNRIEFSIQRSLNEIEFGILTKNLDASVFASAANQWLPRLADEVLKYRDEKDSSNLSAMYHSQRLLKYFRDEEPGLLAKNPISELMHGAGGSIVTSPPSQELRAKDPSNNTQDSPMLLRTQPMQVPDPVSSDREVTANPPKSMNQAVTSNEEPATNWLTLEPEPNPRNQRNPNTRLAIADHGMSIDSENGSVQQKVQDISDDKLLAVNPMFEQFGNSSTRAADSGNLKSPRTQASAGIQRRQNDSSKDDRIPKPPTAAVNNQHSVINQPATEAVVTNSGTNNRVEIASSVPGFQDIPEEELLAANPIFEQIGNEPFKDHSVSNSSRRPMPPMTTRSESTNKETPIDAIPPSVDIAANNSDSRKQSEIRFDKEYYQRNGIADNEWLSENPISQFKQTLDQDESDPAAIPHQRQLANSERTSRMENESDVVEAKITDEFVEQIVAARENDQPGGTGSFDVDRGLDTDEKYVGTLEKSGWFRNDSLMQITYRPRGHADEFISTMMDVVASTQEALENPATGPFFTRMTSKSSVGACNQCHTIDSKDLATHHVNWKPEYRNPMIRSFTRFSHGPHVTQTQLRDCTSCHAMNKEFANAHTFVNFDSTEVISNFEPIKKENCTSCHFKGGTNSGCTQCHNYHVGSKVIVNQ